MDLLAKNQNLYARPVLSATGIDILILWQHFCSEKTRMTEDYQMVRNCDDASVWQTDRWTELLYQSSIALFIQSLMNIHNYTAKIKTEL